MPSPDEVDAALARAETLLKIIGPLDCWEYVALDGWVQAVKALRDAHFSTYPEHQHRSRPSCIPCKAIAGFVAAFPKRKEAPDESI